MGEGLKNAVARICSENSNDRTRMMDIARSVQQEFGCVSDEAIDLIAEKVSVPRVDVESLVSFYMFLSKTPKGKIVIRLCDDIIDRFNGIGKIAKVFSDELGIGFGETTGDGKITLEYTPCIGMSDQAPAVMVNQEIITNLTEGKVKEIVKVLKESGDPAKLVTGFGDGNNGNDLVKSMVQNNIRLKGDVLFSAYEDGSGLKKAFEMSPEAVIDEVKKAGLRGRGGAGFPAGLKWNFTRGATGDKKFVICNADEGEPGTFKDRVILTELADKIFEGMTLAGYAIGAENGILYLRGEYAYLYEYLESVIQARRAKNLLGNDILGKSGVNFDIRIQMGAGAYICGEETALISSCEGERGDPKNRPPFPAQKGYKGFPTSVNNVETLCSALSIFTKGADWFSSIGTNESNGTKLLSVSGDCEKPGVYEVPFGISIEELLDLVGGKGAKALQIGGPSGQMIGESDFGRKIAFEDLATGGSIMIFGQNRDILEVVEYFMEFFVEEECGYCTPCRTGNVLLKKYIEKIRSGKGEPEDLKVMQDLGETVKLASRCGLGQTSPNPVLTTLENFRSVYDALVKTADDGMVPSFDIQAAVSESAGIAGRKSVHFT